MNTAIDLLKRKIEEENIVEFENIVNHFNSILKKYNPYSFTTLNNITEGEFLSLLLIMGNHEGHRFDYLKRLEKFISEEVKDLGPFVEHLKKIIIKVREKKKKEKKAEPKNTDDVLTRFVYKLATEMEPISYAWVYYLEFKYRAQIACYRSNIDYMPISDKEKQKIRDHAFDDFKKECKFDERCEDLFQTQKELNTELNKRRKRVYLYETILKELESGKVYISIDQSWSRLPNDVQIELIKLVLENQNKKHKELEAEEEILEKRTKIFKLLSKYDINPTLIEEVEKENLDPKALEEILKVLEQGKFPINEIKNKDCLVALLRADKQTINALFAYLITGAINIKFLQTYPEILVSKSDDHPEGLKENIEDNFKILKYENASFDSESYDSSILLMNPDDLIKIINLAKCFDLRLSDNPNVFNILREPALLDLIDFAMEHQLPIEEVIKIKGDKKDIMDVIKRFIIAENFGLNTLTEDEEIPYSIATGNSFLVPREKLDDVIENSTPSEQDERVVEVLNKSPRINVGPLDTITKLLDIKYIDEEEKYNFNGTFISRFKILRNKTAIQEHFPDMSDEEAFFQAAIYQTVLTTEELMNVKNCIMPKKGTRKVK